MLGYTHRDILSEMDIQERKIALAQTRPDMSSFKPIKLFPVGGLGTNSLIFL